MSDSHWYRWEAGDLIVLVRLQPRASRNEILSVQDGRLKIRLTSPPIEGKANQALTRFIANYCGVAKQQVTLESGETSRNKRLRIQQPKNLLPGIKLADLRP